MEDEILCYCYKVKKSEVFKFLQENNYYAFMVWTLFKLIDYAGYQINFDQCVLCKQPSWMHKRLDYGIRWCSKAEDNRLVNLCLRENNL